MTKNKFIFLLLLFLSLATFSQPKANYYDSAKGKKGEALRTALHQIINGHTDIGYKGLWGLYHTSDTLHLNGEVYIWDMYSARGDRSANYRYKPGKKQCGNYKVEGDCYNREHSVPQSWFSKEKPMVSDAFHIFPTDGKVNNERGNYPFGEVGEVKYTSTNGSKRGKARSGLGYSKTVFEPIDAYKGDFARGHLYMAVRYKDNCQNWSGDVFGNENGGFKTWAIKMLLRWHREDPVSEKERIRNNAIEKRQNNRNPFIDHPEFAQLIWGDSDDPTWISPIETIQDANAFLVLENPVRDAIKIEHQEESVHYKIFNLSGQYLQSGEIRNSENIGVENLQSGFYLLHLQTGNKQEFLKIIIQK